MARTKAKPSVPRSNDPNWETWIEQLAKDLSRQVADKLPAVLDEIDAEYAKQPPAKKPRKRRTPRK